MATTLLTAKRKNIDIKPETFRALSIKAAEEGINLKKYIEALLDKLAQDEEDLLLYNKFVKNEDECRKYLNKDEQAAFEKEIGL